MRFEPDAEGFTRHANESNITPISKRGAGLLGFVPDPPAMNEAAVVRRASL